MALKTRQTAASVEAFLASIADDARREDCRTVLALMRQATGEEPRMWGESIVGFGSYHYRYATGRTGDWFVMGFSPRKRDLTLYISAGIERYPAILMRLGRCATGRSCLYLKRLADVDVAALRDLIETAAKDAPPPPAPDA